MLETTLLNRVLIVLLLALASVAVYWLFSRLVLLHARRNQARVQSDLPTYQPGRPAILYFTTPECAVCRTTQRPALQQVRAALGERLQMIEINAHERSDLAGSWGVMSVPTTFILDEHGQPLQVNHGAAPAGKLLRQVRQALEGGGCGQIEPSDLGC